MKTMIRESNSTRVSSYLRQKTSHFSPYLVVNSNLSLLKTFSNETRPRKKKNKSFANVKLPL